MGQDDEEETGADFWEQWAKDETEAWENRVKVQQHLADRKVAAAGKKKKEEEES